MEFKKYGAYAILLTIVAGCFTYLPPMFSGAAFIFSAGTKFAEAKDQLATVADRLKEHDTQIGQSLRNIREFRSVWCIDRLADRKVQPMVVKTCTEWIKEP